MTRLRTQAACLRSVEAETLAHRRIDPTNAARRANIVRQHGLNLRDEAPVVRVMPMRVREIVAVFACAGMVVFALVGAMAVFQ